MHASSEATLRSQAELAAQQLQTRLAALEADAASLHASNQVCGCTLLICLPSMPAMHWGSHAMYWHSCPLRPEKFISSALSPS